jgi:hypothetical protein
VSTRAKNKLSKPEKNTHQQSLINKIANKNLRRTTKNENKNKNKQ